jgi:hypothetical protein
MTDRVSQLTVILDEPMRTDDVQMIVDAIRCIRQVKHVELGKPMDPTDYWARYNATHDLSVAVLDFIKEHSKLTGK